MLLLVQYVNYHPRFVQKLLAATSLRKALYNLQPCVRMGRVSFKELQGGTLNLVLVMRGQSGGS